MLAQRFPMDILVAEDNPINQQLAMMILAKMGYTPEMVWNGREVLNKLKEKKFDLIFMDVQMPEMDGLEATRMIRTGAQPQPIIIAMTANAMQGDREKCLAAGMDDYLSKPIRPEDIRKVVEQWGPKVTSASPVQPSAALPNAPASVPTTEPAPVDMERLLDFANGDPANLRELVELYIQQTSKQLVQLNTALAAGNADEVKRLAHSCSGASSTCGMVGMVPPLRELERQGNEGLQPNAGQLAFATTREFQRIQTFLTEYLESQGAPQLAKT
jgi:CheY-like chemotaxis protein/HPt (histidine-containing phosphotransfer) domain-containing protein